MHTFFELSQDNIKEIYTVSGSYFEYPPHLHQKIEIFILLKGKYNTCIDGQNFQLNGGDILFIDSYVIHSYTHFEYDNDGIVLIIPTNVAEKFFARKGNYKVNNFLISDNELCQTIYKLAKKFIAKNDVNDTIKNGAAELVLALLEPKLKLSPPDKSNHNNSTITLLQNILIYIKNNLKEDINLNSLAKTFSYSTVHISRVFNNYMHTSLTDYINAQRINYIETSIKSGSKENITSLIFDAGFKSTQTYYRTKNKLKVKQKENK